MKKAWAKLSRARKRSINIDRFLRRERAQMAKEIHLLLLGAGESGKSTIFKQMRIIHNDPFKDDERETYRQVIYSNIITSINALIKASVNLDIPIENPENRENAKNLREIRPETLTEDDFTPEVAEQVGSVWKDPGIQKVYEQRSKFQLFDSAQYFFENLERISEPDFLPTDEDILRSRVKTTGVTTSTFHFGGFDFKLFDVGGQRNERRKWINFFEDVRAVIFVTSLSEYDQLCYEDDQTNRMQESMILFEEIVNSSFFSATPIILFFNKTDIFREKIQHTDLNILFEDYDGGNDYDAAVAYIKNKFLSLNRSNYHNIHVHETCATDTSNIKEVFENLKEAILAGNLQQ